MKLSEKILSLSFAEVLYSNWNYRILKKRSEGCWIMKLSCQHDEL